MNRLRAFIYHLHPYTLAYVSGALTVAQIILALVLPRPDNQVLRQIGWVLWCGSAVFGWLPIFTLKRKGGVPRGKSFVHTTTLVETGIYAIVRHPQIGTAWLLMNLSLMLVTQHWASVALGIPSMGLSYLDVLKADRRLVEKFGDAYRRYMARVPRVNFLSGIVRLIARRARAYAEAR